MNKKINSLCNNTAYICLLQCPKHQFYQGDICGNFSFEQGSFLPCFTFCIDVFIYSQRNNSSFCLGGAHTVILKSYSNSWFSKRSRDSIGGQFSLCEPLLWYSGRWWWVPHFHIIRMKAREITQRDGFKFFTLNSMVTWAPSYNVVYALNSLIWLAE